MKDEVFDEILKSYCIGDVTDLQEFLEGSVVTIELDSPYIDEVKLALDKHNFIESRNIKKYSNYFIKPNKKDAHLWEIQSLNYSDFINYKHDLIEVIEDELKKTEEIIIEYLEKYISNSISNPQYAEHLINNIIIKRVNHANLWLQNNYILSERANKFVCADGNNISFPLMEKAIDLVGDRQEKFIKRIKDRYQSFYKKSDFELYLDKITFEKFSKQTKPDYFKTQAYYDSFLKYASHNWRNPIKAFGYVFKRMLSEEKIHKKTDMEIANYLKEGGFINYDVYNKIIIKGQFDSLPKSETKDRKAIYNQNFT